MSSKYHVRAALAANDRTLAVVNLYKMGWAIRQVFLSGILSDVDQLILRQDLSDAYDMVAPFSSDELGLLARMRQRYHRVEEAAGRVRMAVIEKLAEELVESIRREFNGNGDG